MPNRRNRREPEIKRPYATYYFHSPTDKIAAASSHGACTNEVGAIRAAAPRLFLEQWQKCQIVDRHTGLVVITLKRNGSGYTTQLGDPDGYRERITELARMMERKVKKAKKLREAEHAVTSHLRRVA
jgi:hypothetical protein